MFSKQTYGYYFKTQLYQVTKTGRSYVFGKNNVFNFYFSVIVSQSIAFILIVRLYVRVL